MVLVQQGLVIAGVVGLTELIPRLLRELERLEPNAVRVGAPRAHDIRRTIPRDPAWFQSRDAEGVVEELICALSDCAGSDELYFGRKSPDSNEFGFWQCRD
jgi:hypothetical protein